MPKKFQLSKMLNCLYDTGPNDAIESDFCQLFFLLSKTTLILFTLKSFEKNERGMKAGVKKKVVSQEFP